MGASITTLNTKALGQKTDATQASATNVFAADLTTTVAGSVIVKFFTDTATVLQMKTDGQLGNVNSGVAFEPGWSVFEMPVIAADSLNFQIVTGPASIQIRVLERTS